MDFILLGRSFKYTSVAPPPYSYDVSHTLSVLTPGLIIGVLRTWVYVQVNVGPPG